MPNLHIIQPFVMNREPGFHGLKAWFAPEYEEAYSPIWVKHGGQLESLEEADLAVVTHVDPDADGSSYMAIKLLRPDKIHGLDGLTCFSFAKFKRVFPALEAMDISTTRQLEGMAAYDATRVIRFDAPPRPTLVPSDDMAPSLMSQKSSPFELLPKDDVLYSNSQSRTQYGSPQEDDLRSLQAHDDSCSTGSSQAARSDHMEGCKSQSTRRHKRTLPRTFSCRTDTYFRATKNTSTVVDIFSSSSEQEEEAGIGPSLQREGLQGAELPSATYPRLHTSIGSQSYSVERIEQFCQRHCSQDLSKRKNLETALTMVRTKFTLIDLMNDPERWDVRQGEN